MLLVHSWCINALQLILSSRQLTPVAFLIKGDQAVFREYPTGSWTGVHCRLNVEYHKCEVMLCNVQREGMRLQWNTCTGGTTKQHTSNWQVEPCVARNVSNTTMHCMMFSCRTTLLFTAMVQHVLQKKETAAHEALPHSAQVYIVHTMHRLHNQQKGASTK